MSSRLLVNLIDPSEIVVPDTDGVPDAGAPDTGILSIGKWLDEAFNNNNTALFIAIGLIVLAVAVIIVLLIRRRKKQSSINGFGGYVPMKLGAQKHLIPKLAGLSFIILVSVFGILKFNDNQRMASAEAVDGPSLTVTTEDITAIDIEMEDEAVFGVGESKVKVTTATDTGYTLMAYVDSTTTDLTNDSGDKIAMLETSQSQALTDNTWGISLSKPDSQDKTLFRGLPTVEKDAMVVKVSGSDATEANDETTLYYATYVTPDLDYGTYEGVTINYVAVAHVIDEDVTVNFHGNGYYFDEAGTKDVNTVVYGTSCELAYVGGNCSKIYTTEQPAEIVKTPNIRDDGTQNGPYEIPERVKVGMVSISGADFLKIELIYDANDEIVIAQGDENLIEEPAVYEMFFGQGETTYIVKGDTASFGVLDSPIFSTEVHNYGFYAKVYPIFYQKPENIETIEDTYCHFAKSNNLDDEGNMIESYGPQYIQSVMLPGADRIKIEIEYALTDEADIGIFEGRINNDGPILIDTSPVYAIGTWDRDSDTGSNVSGKETITVDGDTLTFVMYAYNPPVSGYDYGFYARLYPIYDEEHEDTIPEQTCSLTNKSGEYSSPVEYDYISNRYIWYNVLDDDGYLTEGDWFRDDEKDIASYITYYYDELAGKTLDIYLDNPYIIYYDANGGSGYMNEWWVLPHMNETIPYNEFTNSSYEFIGWNTRADGTGTWYQPGDVVLDLAQPGGTITLYAQWEIDVNCNPNATTISGALCMQDFAGPNSEQIVSSMAPETQYTLVDGRDGKSYTITKILLGDEYEVWMTQNLDHNIVATANFYTYANTDIGHGSILNANAKWTASNATYGTGNSTWSNSYVAPESYDPGDLCWDGTITSYYYGTLSDYAGACGDDRHYHIGNYYNWTAAVAMNDSSSYTSLMTDLDQSICPAGWRLPTHSGGKSYKNLVTQLSLTAGESGNVQNMPVYFIYGGFWRGSSDEVGYYNSYWSSVVGGEYGAYGFYYNHGLFETQSIGYRSYGDSVRCVARTSEIGPSISISDLTYMQDFATLTSGEKSEVLASMIEGQQYQLKDNRDEKTYYVSKLADGNVWMTQNLAHNIVTTTDFYTYANTDIGHGSITNTQATWTAERATYINQYWNNVDDYYSDPESYDSGDLCWNGMLGNYNCNNDNHYRVGNYYNWTAAVAMNDSSNYTTDKEDVDQSICPAGWRLPTYSGDKSYDNLVTELSLIGGTSGNVQNAPVYFVYGGHWHGVDVGVGDSGLYWSSVVNDGDGAYVFVLGSSGVTPQGLVSRYYGNSVRCVAR